MDCFNNFCLSCDQECEGHYCSQACKLTDIERGVHMSSPNSPTSPPTLSRPNAWQTKRQTSAYVLDPPYNFSAKSLSSHASRYSGAAYSMSSSSHGSSVNSFQPPERSLTPSSSRSSLSSTASSSGVTPTMTAKNNQQLQDYFEAFEKVRAAKRRSSLR